VSGLRLPRDPLFEPGDGWGHSLIQFHELLDTTMSNRVPSLSADLDQFAILLDVDGTILDFAPTPREVFVSHDLRDTLARLWDRTRGALAFVSGRPVSELDLIFSPLQLPAIGGHGAELRIIPGAAPEAPRLPALDPGIKRQFAAIAEAGPGIVLEDKGYSLALHYRLAPEKEPVVRAAAARVCASLKAAPIELLPGKFVVEIKQTGFTKATAVRELMTYKPFSERRPIFIGDDVTDLGVFEVLPDFHGIGISVGRNVPGVEACFEQPTDVRHWLDKISRNEAFAAS
jgi:trehalose 6-phosphate phosphatase